MDYEQNRKAYFVDPAPEPRFGFRGTFNTTLFYEDHELAVAVLELGTGNLTRCLLTAEPTVTLIGVDFSAEMIRRSRYKLPDVLVLPLELTTDDWSILADRRFARVVATYVLHELPLPRVVAILSRLRDASGVTRIVFGEISYATGALRERALQSIDEEAEDEFYFAADEAYDSFSAAGFAADYRQISSCGGGYALDAR